MLRWWTRTLKGALQDRAPLQSTAARIQRQCRCLMRLQPLAFRLLLLLRLLLLRLLLLLL